MKDMAGAFTCLLALICAGINAQVTAAQSVKVTFYYTNLDEWNEHSSTATFQSIVSSAANTYCENHLTSCGLHEWLSNIPFRPSNVIILDGYPAKMKSNIVIEVRVEMNQTMNITNPAQAHLNADVVRTILKNSRDNLKMATESWIIYIDAEHISPPPDYRANEIIIPIACAVFLLLIIVTLSLHYWRKKKDKLERKIGHGKSRVSPNHMHSADYADGRPKLNQPEMIYPPSRHHKIVDHNSSLHTATPSNISMTTESAETAKHSNETEKEKRKRHKKRHHRKKKEREGEATGEQDDGLNYSYTRFAGSGQENYNGYDMNAGRQDSNTIEMHRANGLV